MSDEADSFGEWVRPWWAAMARTARLSVGGDEWEDVLQSALGLAWRRRATFDATRGTPRTWLLTLVVDQSRKHRRARMFRPAPARLSEITLTGQAGNLAGTDIDLERAVAKLSLRQRQTVTLFYFMDLPVAEVARVLGCSVGTVKSTLSDARSRLRITLDGVPK